MLLLKSNLRFKQMFRFALTIGLSLVLASCGGTSPSSGDASSDTTPPVSSCISKSTKPENLNQNPALAQINRNKQSQCDGSSASPD
jgi:hypothetical protein